MLSPSTPSEEVVTAVTVDGKKRFLIEAKSIGVELKEAHVRQAVDYAANEGISNEKTIGDFTRLVEQTWIPQRGPGN